MTEAIKLSPGFESRVPKKHKSNLIFDTSFLVLRIRGKKKFAELWGPIYISNYSIGGIVGI